jgi:trimeric autotransporter adhesin
MRPLQIIASFLFGSIFFALIAAAWTGPSSSPPNGNVAAPINIGNIDQIKNANLGVNGLAVFGNTHLNGSFPTYLNFGATAGSSGYGMRDNSGTLEFKNSGGSWASIQSTVNTLLSGSGQWTTGSGGAIYYNGGNIGVGHTVPNRRLDVSSNGGSDGLTIGQQADNTESIQTYIDGQWANRVTYAGGCCNALLLQPDVGVVGIRTASPAYTLDVNGSGRFASGPFTDDWFRVNGAGGIYWQAYGGGWYMSNGYWIRAYSNNGVWLNGGNFGTNGGLTIGYGGAGVPAGGAIIAGSVGIGTQSPDRPLEVSGQIEAHQPQGTTDGGFRLKGPPDNSYSVIQFVNNAGNSEWQYIAATPQNNIGIGTTNPSQRLDVTGNVLAYGYQYYSDISLKKVIAPIADALSKVLGLVGVSFLWKAHPEQGPQIGFIAQDVEKIVPELVTTAPSGLKSVDYARVSALLVNAIKELDATISGFAHKFVTHEVDTDKLCVTDCPNDNSPLCVTKSQLAALLAK